MGSTNVQISFVLLHSLTCVTSISLKEWCSVFSSRSQNHVLAACSNHLTSSFKSSVPNLMLVNVSNVTVVLCGVWSAWGNGLPVDKTRAPQELGCPVLRPVQRAGQRFVFWMCVWPFRRHIEPVCRACQVQAQDFSINSGRWTPQAGSKFS